MDAIQTKEEKFLGDQPVEADYEEECADDCDPGPSEEDLKYARRYRRRFHTEPANRDGRDPKKDEYELHSYGFTLDGAIIILGEEDNYKRYNEARRVVKLDEENVAYFSKRTGPGADRTLRDAHERLSRANWALDSVLGDIKFDLGRLDRQASASFSELILEQAANVHDTKPACTIPH